MPKHAKACPLTFMAQAVGKKDKLYLYVDVFFISFMKCIFSLISKVSAYGCVCMTNVGAPI